MDDKNKIEIRGGKLRMKADANHPKTIAKQARQEFRAARQSLRAANFNGLTNNQKIDTLRDALRVVFDMLRADVIEDKDAD
jgi:hypothetical protein